MAIIRPHTEVNESHRDTDFLRSRGVEEFVHFTPAENLESILENGIMPRSELDSQGISYSYTDSLRLEGSHVVNLSITNPNIKMFYGKRKDSRNKTFAVLSIDPSVLTDPEIKYSFTSTNAASSRAQECHIEDLFGGDRPSYFESNWPTDNQAEVLIEGRIKPTYIRSIHFPESAQATDTSLSTTVLSMFSLSHGLSCTIEFCDKHFEYNTSALGALEPQEKYEYYFASWSGTEEDAAIAEEAVRGIEVTKVFDSIAVHASELKPGIPGAGRQNLPQPWQARFLEPDNSKYERDVQQLAAFSVLEKIINRGRVTVLSEKLESLCKSQEAIEKAHQIQCVLLELVKRQMLRPGMAISSDAYALSDALDDLIELSRNVCVLYGCDNLLEGIHVAEEGETASLEIRWSDDTDPVGNREVRISSCPLSPGSVEFDFTRLIEPANVTVDRDALAFLLQYIFRFDGFREGQFNAVRRGLLRKDSIVLLPTGSGKSAVFQLLSLITPGISFVVCPIISLIEDQVANLIGRGIDRIAGISSNVSSDEKNAILDGITNGQYLISYIAPERFQNRKFNDAVRRYASKNLISVVAIDEAHCVSEWGHNFRIAYLGLADTCRDVCNTQGAVPPLIALTGTASTSVLIDMKADLKITDESAIIAPATFDRPEIHYRVIKVPSERKQEALEQIISEHIPRDFNVSGDEFFTPTGTDETNCGIVFCQNVNGKYGLLASPKQFAHNHKGVWDYLNERLPGYCGFYSGSEPKRRLEQHRGSSWIKVKQEQASRFKGNKSSIMVATSAFGMGIDKPNVRWIAHYGIPSSLESYYQEVGRAARDRNVAYAYLILSDDFPDLNSMILDPSKTAVSAIGELEESKGEWNGDDVSRTLFFHTSTFAGVAYELDTARQLLDACGRDNYDYIEHNWKLRFNSGTKSDMERAIYRFHILGVFDGYEIEYDSFGSGDFIINPTSKSDNLRSHIEECYLNYVASYQPDKAYLSAAKQNFQAAVSKAVSNRDYIMLAMEHLLKEFTYKVLEEGRRRATLTMLQTAELAAKAGRLNESDEPFGSTNEIEDLDAVDAEFRQRLLNYLSLDGQEGPKGLKAIISRATDIDLLIEIISEHSSQGEMPSLLGQTSRLLEDYPQHYGMHYIQAASHLLSGNVEHMESSLRSALVFGTDNYGLSPVQCLDNWIRLLNLLKASSLSYLDKVILGTCKAFSIDRQELLKRLTTNGVQDLKIIDRAYENALDIEEGLAWMRRK